MYNYNDVEGAPTPQLSTAARDDLQCNIIHSAMHFRSSQLFVRFETPEEFRDWLRNTPAVTSEAGCSGSAAAVNLLFTAAGLRRLGLAAAVASMDPAFQRGARAEDTLARLSDPAPGTWTGHEQPWDAALLVHSNQPVVLPLPKSHLLERGNSLDEKGQVIPESALPDTPRFNVYGYADGISINHYEGDHSPTASGYDSRYKLSTLLAVDPLSNASRRFGSYFVFRKYEQDVEAFEKKVQQIAQAIEQREKNPGNEMPLSGRFPIFRGVKGADLRLLVKAWIMGRYPDGKPLVGSAPNDFKLSDDANGIQCPFHAHIAKMNPRGRTGDAEQERSRILARRGISFGSRNAKEKGLLFWCAQSKIIDQFEYIQQHWANDSNVDIKLRPTPDLDNVIGKRVEGGAFETVTDAYPKETRRYDRWKGTIDADFGIYDTITLKGSEYFFAPSLPGIQALKGVS